eukprot:Pgem_evm1s4405
MRDFLTNNAKNGYMNKTEISSNITEGSNKHVNSNLNNIVGKTEKNVSSGKECHSAKLMRKSNLASLSRKQQLNQTFDFRTKKQETK